MTDLSWWHVSAVGTCHVSAGCQSNQLHPVVEIGAVLLNVNHPRQVRSVQAAKADGSIQQKMDQRHLQSSSAD